MKKRSSARVAILDPALSLLKLLPAVILGFIGWGLVHEELAWSALTMLSMVAYFAEDQRPPGF
jgi:hypothetical protein